MRTRLRRCYRTHHVVRRRHAADYGIRGQEVVERRGFEPSGVSPSGAIGRKKALPSKPALPHPTQPENSTIRRLQTTGQPKHPRPREIAFWCYCSGLSRESGNPTSERIGDRPKSDSIVLSVFRIASYTRYPELGAPTIYLLLCLVG